MGGGLETAVEIALPLLALPAWLAGRLRWGIGGGSERWGAAALSASALAFALARAASVHAGAVFDGSAPTPTLADGASVLSLLLLVLGTLLLCSQRLPAASRLRIIADRLMVMSAAGTFSWYFITGPFLSASGIGMLERATGVLYAGFDLLLVLSLLVLTTRLRATHLRPAMAPLGLGTATILVCHSLSAYAMTHHGLTVQPALGLAWAAGYSLVGLAGVAALGGMRRARASDTREDANAPSATGTPNLWRYLLPYALIPGVVALMVYEAHHRTGSFIETGIYIAVSVMIEMIFVHQFLAYRELTSYANRSARLESLVAADPITGLPNHRSVVTSLDALLARATSQQTPLSVLFLDLDHFKALNDHYGHSSGDRALREFAAVVRTGLRDTDILGRWGGEEFVALLPETDRASALAVAERVCAAVAAHTFRTVGGSRITCSIGMANYPLDAGDRGSLVEEADAAMYAAKAGGRNRVCAAGHPQPLAETETRGEVAAAGIITALQSLAAVHGVDPADEGALVELAIRMARALHMDAPAVRAVEGAMRLRDIGRRASLHPGIALPGDEDQSHPEVGAEVVSCVPALRMLAPAIRAHHERWNGTGYPDGLAGEAIPPIARLIAVAERYHALLTGEDHRYPLAPAAALAEIARQAGSSFDPAAVDALTRVVSADLPMESQSEIA